MEIVDIYTMRQSSNVWEFYCKNAFNGVQYECH